MKLRQRTIGRIRSVAVSLLAGSIAFTPAPLPANTTPAAPPNLLVLTERIVSAGQPSAAWLQTLRAQGFEAVVYLAPPTVPDAVREEPHIVASQGLLFIHLPIDFRQPTERDFDTFATLMHGLSERKVLVHCQVNMRASTLLFLYRVIHQRAAPEAAYANVTRIWSPNEVWMQLVRAQLRKHRIDFDPM